MSVTADAGDRGTAGDSQVPMDAALPDSQPRGEDGDASSSDPSDSATDAGLDKGIADAGLAPRTLMLTSPAFEAGAAIPVAHSCQEADLQPALAWTGVPEGTQSFALVLIDDTFDYVHWVAYDLPANVSSLPEAASDRGTLPPPAREAMGYGVRYRGPCPPDRHTYSFRLYALDVATVDFTAVNPIRDEDVERAFSSRTLARATLTGTFTP